MFIGIPETSRVENTKTELSSGGTLFGVPHEEGSTSGTPIDNLKWNYPLADKQFGLPLAEGSINRTPTEHKNGAILVQNSVWCTT